MCSLQPSCSSLSPWGRQCTPLESPWRGPPGGGAGWQVYLPHEVLDAAQLALDAGSVQQGLPHIIAPVPLWAQAPQREEQSLGDRAALAGPTGDIHSPCCPHLAHLVPAQAAWQVLVLQLLELAVGLVLCKSRAHPRVSLRAGAWPWLPAHSNPAYGHSHPRPVCPADLAPHADPDLCCPSPGKHPSWARRPAPAPCATPLFPSAPAICSLLCLWPFLEPSFLL